MPNPLPTADHTWASPLGLDEISVADLGEQSAKRLRRSQIRGAIRQSRLFVMGNTLFAPFLSFQAWDMADPRLVIGWTAIMVSFSWWLFWAWRDGDYDRYENDGWIKQTNDSADDWTDLDNFLGVMNNASGPGICPRNAV